MRYSLRHRLLSYLVLVFLIWGIYYVSWSRHLYIVTAYCGCPICVNVPEYRDGKFASGKKIYWGGIAADAKVPFGAKVELFPMNPKNMVAMMKILKGRTRYVVEDRGGKIKGRHIDIYIPDEMGGHKTALKWGVRRMRILINGRWAD